MYKFIDLSVSYHNGATEPYKVSCSQLICIADMYCGLVSGAAIFED